MTTNSRKRKDIMKINFQFCSGREGGEAIEGWEEAHAQDPQDGTTQAEVNWPSTHAVGGRGTESGKVPEGLAHSQ